MSRIIPCCSGERETVRNGRTESQITAADTPAIAQPGGHAAQSRAADVKAYTAQSVFGFPTGQGNIEHKTLFAVIGVTVRYLHTASAAEIHREKVSDKNQTSHTAR